MATPPTFSVGATLTAAQMNAVGMWLVKSQAVGTGVSSVTVTNAFTSDFDNYLVQYVGQMSILCTINTTLGASTTGYYNALQYTNFAAPGAGLLVNNNATGAFTFSGVGSTTYASYNLKVDDPFLAKKTRVNGIYTSETDTGTFSGFHNVATSYSSITLAGIGGTFQGGTIYVYGFRK